MTYSWAMYSGPTRPILWDNVIGQYVDMLGNFS